YSHREPLTDAVIGKMRRHRKLDDHLGFLAKLVQRHRDDEVAFRVVAIDRWPAAHCPPGEDELLHRYNLAIHAAGEIFEVIVYAHFLPPLAAHPQIHENRVRRNGPGVVEEPLKALGIGPCLEDQISWRVKDPLQGKAAL